MTAVSSLVVSVIIVAESWMTSGTFLMRPVPALYHAIHVTGMVTITQSVKTAALPATVSALSRSISRMGHFSSVTVSLTGLPPHI